MHSRSKVWRLLVAVVMLSAGGYVAPGCGGPSGANICDTRCQCEGCSPVAYDNCRADADRDLDTTDRLGCGPYLDDLLACENATAVCMGAHFMTTCGPEHDRWKNCTDPKGKP